MREEGPFQEAIAQLREAAGAKKCWSCGCLHHSLDAVERAVPKEQRPPFLEAALQTARERLVPVRYDCLGCEVCYPAMAVNAITRATGELTGELCPAETVEQRDGWPPLPGAYTVLRYRASVAVCTLTDDALAEAVLHAAPSEVGIVGTLQTENLGIERLMLNVLANPNIRFVIACGRDSRQAIGHLPGHSLIALARNGLDAQSRIVGAKGKRPMLRNIGRDAAEHFRRTIEVVDLITTAQLSDILGMVKNCAERNPGPAEPFAPERVMAPLTGYLPDRMIPDPVGYFVIYADRRRRLLSLEHYRNDGAINAIIEGHTAAEIYTPAIQEGLISRLDHAAYVGRELARAEHALLTGGHYLQDAAPELSRPLSVSAQGGCTATACCEHGPARDDSSGA